MAIMNELPEINGKICVGGRVAYASQQPWVFSGTVKKNITFYNEDTFNNERYSEVIQACSLDKVCCLFEFKVDRHCKGHMTTLLA